MPRPTVHRCSFALSACLAAHVLSGRSPLQAQPAMGFNSTLFAPSRVTDVNSLAGGPDGAIWFAGERTALGRLAN
jgi:streptogramin lyase